MAKVTVVITPEEDIEGIGPQLMISQGGVLTLDQLALVYLAAAKGGGWCVNDVGMSTDSGKVVWSA